jgi:hypothetical protein
MKANSQNFKCLLAVLYLLNGIDGNGQSIKSFDKVEIQTLYINAKDSLVRFQVMSDSKKVKFEPGLQYAWFKSNTILRTMGGADGKLLNGEYTCFYPDNNLKEKGKFSKGVKNGSWINWYENGKMQAIITWKLGKLHGIHKIYDSDGKVIVSEKYRRGSVVKEKKKEIKNDKHPTDKSISKDSSSADHKNKTKVAKEKKKNSSADKTTERIVQKKSAPVTIPKKKN